LGKSAPLALRDAFPGFVFDREGIVGPCGVVSPFLTPPFFQFLPFFIGASVICFSPCLAFSRVPGPFTLPLLSNPEFGLARCLVVSPLTDIFFSGPLHGEEYRVFSLTVFFFLAFFRLALIVFGLLPFFSGGSFSLFFSSLFCWRPSPLRSRDRFWPDGENPC